MGTNYYFENKQSAKEAEIHNRKLDSLLNKFKDELIELGCKEDSVMDKLEDIRWSNGCHVKQIHIGKRSAGWTPLFEIQDEYQGIKGMREWFEKNKDEWLILDEYNAIFTWEDLEKELINWNKDNPDARSHVNSEWGSYYNVIDGFEWHKGEFS